MPEFEIEFTFEADGRITIEAEDDDAAVAQFEAMDDSELRGCIGWSSRDIMHIEEAMGDDG